MASVSNITGRLYPDTPRGRHDDLRQSVIDRALTIPGSQAWRPGYGSLASRLNIADVGDVANSITQVLWKGSYRDPRITGVRIIRQGTDLRVEITGTSAELVVL